MTELSLTVSLALGYNNKPRQNKIKIYTKQTLAGKVNGASLTRSIKPHT